MKGSKSWWLLLVISLAVMIPFIAPYLTLNPAYSRIPIASADVQYPLLVLHIASAFIALVAGFVQFLNQIRVKKPGIHRLIGKVYVGTVFVSGLLAIPLIYYAENFTKATAFLALVLVWLFSTWRGYRTAGRREFEEHRIWMTRSFGITLVAVGARLLVPVLMLAYYVLNGFAIPGGMKAMLDAILNVNVWAGLVLHLAIVEWGVLGRRGRPG
jgi:uncharacterized membrane protein